MALRAVKENVFTIYGDIFSTRASRAGLARQHNRPLLINKFILRGRNFCTKIIEEIEGHSNSSRKILLEKNSMAFQFLERKFISNYEQI